VPHEKASMSDISPDRFIDNVFAYQKTSAVKAAIELDLFSAIGGGADNAETLAAKVNASPRGVRILCDYLTVQELLIKDGNSYRLTPSSSVFLDKRSPACMTSIVDFLAAPEMMRLYLDDPAAFVRNGGSVGLANLAPDHPLWVKFARAMVPFIAPRAQSVAEEVARWPSPPRKVLDVAAGHGAFGIAIGKALPDAGIVALDWRPVLEVALENARREGLGARYTTIAGNAVDVEWGTGYDLVLIPNFLHHFDRDGCVSLLERARRALAPGGAVVVVEMVPNDDRVSPPFPAMFAFVMLGSTPKGDAHTAPELQEMGRAAGFADSTVAPLPPSPQTMIVFR
jgi:2-polyprenyl-3-methyl-5-hydroxy-6-metoxy-1,4-benzoquinol methylase